MRSHIHKRSLILWAVMFGLLAAFIMFGPMLAETIRHSESHYRSKIGNALRVAGVEAYWSMDELVLSEQVHNALITTDGTRRVPGVKGYAREFISEANGYIRTDLPYNIARPPFTFSCWLKFTDNIPDQSICKYLVTKNGILTTAFSHQASPLGWPIDIHNRFFHVALTLDGSAKTSNVVGRLYIDGKRIAEAPLGSVSTDGHLLCFGEDRWTPPAQFSLDEVSLWNRSLSPDEISRLCKPGQSIRARGVAIRRLKLAACEWLGELIHSIDTVADLFNPTLNPGRLNRIGLADFSLVLSKRDIKAFNRYVNDRLDAGISVYGVSEKRCISVLRDGALGSASMRVLGSRQRFKYGHPKPSYIVTVDNDADNAGIEKWLFQTPEESPFLLQLLASQLAEAVRYPVQAPELCTLNINGGQPGLYLFEKLQVERSLPSVSATNGWKQCLKVLPVCSSEILRTFDSLADQYEPVFTSDKKSPLNRREMAWAIERQRKQLLAFLEKPDVWSNEMLVKRVCDYIAPELFLGQNLMACSIRTALDFSATNINGVAISFQSLSPELLDNHGRILEGLDSPVDRNVSVQVTARRGGVEMNKTLRFTIAGSGRRLPVLDIQTAGSFTEFEPAQCHVGMLEENGRRHNLPCGEIHLRGNTALVKAKKSYYEIEFDKPHGIDGLVTSRHLLLTSMYRDPTLMRDKLAYDLFRSFSKPGKPRYAPHSRFVEVVLNGEYVGVYEMTDRVDSELLGFAAKFDDPTAPAVLYKAVGEGATFERRSQANYVQKLPRWKKGSYWGPYNDLMDFVGHSDSNTFARQVEQLIDVDNIIDFELLLSLSCNGEGRNFNLFIARNGGPGEKFFLVPWDYDMAFWKPVKANNYLIDRLHRDLPGYTTRLKARWKELREGPLENGRVMALLDDLYAQLGRGGAERNFNRWPHPNYPYEPNVEFLRSWLQTRLAKIDAIIAATPSN
jgi:hypothetical protein